MTKVVLAALFLAFVLPGQPARGAAGDEVTVWRLVYPPDGQAGPPNLWCFTYRKLTPVGVDPRRCGTDQSRTAGGGGDRGGRALDGAGHAAKRSVR
jgi:hypothetical protein